MERLISLSGLLVMVALAFAMGADRRKVHLRLVAAGVGMQFLLALPVLFYARAQPPLESAEGRWHFFVNWLRLLPARFLTVNPSPGIRSE